GGGEIEAAKFAVVHKKTLFRRKRGCARALRPRIIPECGSGCGGNLNAKAAWAKAYRKENRAFFIP
ncbi:MAG: hypothetical protein ACRCUH_08275, partial [Shewanella sp.]